MGHSIPWKIAAVFFVSAYLIPSLAAAQHPSEKRPAKTVPKPEDNSLSREVRHQLLVLPYYSVFDYIAFTLDAGKVTLTGDVVRPTLRSDAEAAVKSIEGVTAVNNLIEILPRSATDDDLRRTVYRAIFEDPALERYAVADVPTIHIILREGSITLEGVVGSESDKSLAGTRASRVDGVSSVRNNLVIRAKEAPTN